jgi:hypothetical protein
MPNIEDRVLADADTLESMTGAVEFAVAQYNERKNDHAIDPIAVPLAALVNATARNKDAAWGAMGRALELLDGEPEPLVEFLTLAEQLHKRFAPAIDTMDISAAVAAAERLTALAASPYVDDMVDADTLAAAKAIVAKWKVAEAGYLAVIKAGDKTRTTYQVGRGGRGNPRGRGGRGRGAWVEEHGWYFDAVCESCGAHVSSRSNTGSFQNDMAKHWPSCRGENGGPIMYVGDDGVSRRVERVMWHDVDPEYAAAHDGFSNAMYAVARDVDQAEGGGFIISRVAEGAASAA